MFMANRVPALSPDEVREGLKKLPSWTLKEGKLHRDFTFKKFTEAFAFMTKVAAVADKQDHHPEWSNVYNRVSVELITHDAGPALSERDLRFAREVDLIAPAR